MLLLKVCESFRSDRAWNYNTNKNKHVRITLVICATQLADGSLLKKLKYFEVMINVFEFSRVLENVES